MLIKNVASQTNNTLLENLSSSRLGPRNPHFGDFVGGCIGSTLEILLRVSCCL